MKNIILASGSPRRKKLMELLGIPFEIKASNYDESISTYSTPEQLVKELSLGKAKDVADKTKNAVVIGADTIVYFQNKVIGKPHTQEKALETLKELRGKTHSVFTGISIIDTDTNIVIQRAVETKVYFKNLTDTEIENYVTKENVLDAAGAYKIQQLGSILIDKIEGDFNNAVGLPISILVDMFKEVGIHII